ncbi:hypothetical protein [Streptomyces sp. NPDC059994]
MFLIDFTRFLRAHIYLIAIIELGIMGATLPAAAELLNDQH